MKRPTLPRLVVAHHCAECLFTPERIVSPERMKEIVTQCEKRTKFFECHQFSKIICYGSWLLHTTPKMREVAEAARWVRYVEPKNDEQEKVSSGRKNS